MLHNNNTIYYSVLNSSMNIKYLKLNKNMNIFYLGDHKAVQIFQYFLGVHARNSIPLTGDVLTCSHGSDWTFQEYRMFFPWDLIQGLSVPKVGPESTDVCGSSSDDKTKVPTQLRNGGLSCLQPDKADYQSTGSV